MPLTCWIRFATALALLPVAQEDDKAGVVQVAIAFQRSTAPVPSARFVLDIQGETPEARQRIATRALQGWNGHIGSVREALRCVEPGECALRGGTDLVVVTILKLHESSAIVDVAGASVLTGTRLLRASDQIEVVKSDGKWRFGRVISSEIH